jgi:hypothetical protein
LKMDRISKNVQKNANNECKNGLKKNRENRRYNQEWTIQRHWQRWTHKTQVEDKQNTKTQHRKLKRWATRTPPKIGVNPGVRKGYGMPLIRHPQFYSYSHDVFDTTIHKHTTNNLN